MLLESLTGNYETPAQETIFAVRFSVFIRDFYYLEHSNAGAENIL